MNYLDRTGKTVRLIFAVSLVLFAAGCAGEKAAIKDPASEKWDTLAETSQGYSPSRRALPSIVQEKIRSGEALSSPGVTSVTGKSLPKQKVTMKMRQADVKALLRALARVVSQNIIVNEEIKGLTSVDFHDIPWDQAFRSILKAQGLSYAWEGDIIRVMTVENMEHELKVSAVSDKRLAQEMEVRRVEPLVTMVVNIDYADIKGLKENLQEFLTKDKDGKPHGSVKVDGHSNALIIQAIRDDLSKMLPIIEVIDKPTPQILIKANIVETTKETARDLGIQWGGMYGAQVGDHGLFVTPGGTGGTGTPFSGGYSPSSGSKGISGQGFGVNFPSNAANAASGVTLKTGGNLGALGLMFGTIGGNILDIQLNALQKDGKLRIISSPSITTLDNNTAFTENGEKVPYVSYDTSSSGGFGGQGQQQVKFEDAVLRLEITPHVIDGKNLKMDILVKKDEVDMTRTVQGNPFIIKKQTHTSLIVQDGETIVISGLTKQRKSDAGSGVPWFKDIPVLGWLFKGEGKFESMEEVLIFITPNILPSRLAVVTPDKPVK